MPQDTCEYRVVICLSQEGTELRIFSPSVSPDEIAAWVNMRTNGTEHFETRESAMRFVKTLGRKPVLIGESVPN